MIFRNSGFADQLLYQHLPKAARVRHRQPDVLIKVKSFHSFPVNSWRSRKRVEELDLRSCSRCYNSRGATIGNRVADGAGCLLGSSMAERCLVRKDFYPHTKSPW